MSSSLQSADDTRPREVHRAAMMLTLLVLLSGSISLAVVPWEPFWIPNIAQSAVCVAFLVYLLRTWKHPHRRMAEAISAVVIVYTLLLVPWLTVTWCRLGRPLDAFAVPEAALVSIALLYRGPSRFGAAAMSLFAAENLFVYVYAHQLGLDEILPINGPTGTIGIFAVAIGIYVLRRRHNELLREHVRARAEIEALERVRPLFAHARNELGAQVDIVAAEVRASCSTETLSSSRAVHRSLDRLGALGEELGAVIAGDESAPSQRDAERQLRDYDAQLGAMLLAAVGVAMNAMACLTLHWQLYEVPRPFLAKLVFDGVFVVYLAFTLRRPSSRRALWAVIACYVTALATVTYTASWLLHGHRSYTPFMGHKALMGILGLTLGTRFKLGIALILVTAAQAMVLWFVLDLGAHRDVIPVAEPWLTLIYMAIALTSLRMVAQGQTASIQLQRTQAEASAMQRRARMFLALRDRLNSPLQTLVLGAEGDTFDLSASGSERVHGAIDRLVQLSRELAGIDLRVPLGAPSIDADRELRPHI